MTLAVPLTASFPAQGAAALAGQLRAAGLAEVLPAPAGGPAAGLRHLAALARAGTGPLVVCGTDVVAHTAALLTLVTEPGDGSVALVGAVEDATAWSAAVREDRGRVVAAAPAGAVDGGTGAFLGVLRVGRADLPVLAECAERLAAGLAAGTAPTAGDPADLLLPELVQAGVRVAACRVRLLVAGRAAGAPAAAALRARMAAVDEDAARLRSAVKERDDFFTTYFVSPISPRVVRLAARAGLSPTAVTAVSVVLAVVAALAFATGGRPALVAGGVLLYVSFLLDCVDGQLARYSRRFSAFGGWLDTMADRSKEYLVYAGLAVGAVRTGLGDAWPLALAAMVLQTVRHMTDTWYGALHDEAVARRPASGAPPAVGGIGARLGQASDRVQAGAGSPAYWLKRIVVFPIGERWALIALTAALGNGRIALLAVLGWGGFAAAYTLALRTLRAQAMRVPVLTTVDVPRHRDDGPLARGPVSRLGARARLAPLPAAALGAVAGGALAAAGVAGALPAGPARAAWILAAATAVLLAGLPAAAPHAGALDWLVPAALRAAEYLFTVGVALAYDVPMPLLFALLFALALRHYDLTARLEKRAVAAPARPWDLGWDGRVVVLAVAAAAGAAVAVITALTGYVVVMFCLGVVGAWAGARRPAGVGVGASR